MRHSRTLSEGWQFAADLDAPATVASDELVPPPDGWRGVAVPGYWQAQFRDLAHATGVAWYRLALDLDESWFAEDSLALDFGAVAHYCQGWLNGQYLGHHEGGHLPFSWMLRPAAHVGTNALYLRVVTPSGDVHRYPDFPFEETLHGKQSWYGPSGGIWQEVRLESRSAHAVDRFEVVADESLAAVSVGVELAAAAEDSHVHVRILSPAGEEVAETHADPGSSVVLPLDRSAIHRWSPDSPALYTARATVVVDGRTVDTVDKRFGLRTFTSENGRFVLNGRPIIMRGVLDQDYWDSPGVPVDRRAIEERFEAVKAMGFNTLRCHIKAPDPRYLDVADELGLLVWCEMPTTSWLTPAARRRFEGVLQGLVARDRHHPSIVVWGIANEAWGFDLIGSEEHRSWLNELFHATRDAAPDRLIVDNSPCAPNFHVETDIEDYHLYAVMPEMRPQWDDFLEAFVTRTAATFSPFGDATRTGTEPLVVSEFGAWGLPDLSDVTDGHGREPWWFETGQEWAAGAAYLHGAQRRSELWHLHRVFGSWAGLCAETQRRQFETLRYQIRSMRSRPEIAGYVLTELSDVYWEANGVLDMFGRPRGFANRLAELNRSPAVIPHVDRLTVWDGDAVSVEIAAVNDDVDRNEVEVRCGLAGTDDPVSREAFALPPMGTHVTAAVEVRATCEGRPVHASIECLLMSDGVRTVATEQNVLVLPRTGPQVPPGHPIAVHDDRLAERLSTMGYAVTDGEAEFRVVTGLRDDDHHALQRGGRALLIVGDTDALGGGFGEYPRLEVVPWREALFGGGEWVSAFSWLRRVGRFVDLPGGPMMDEYFEGLAPDFVITGIPPARYEYDVMGGVFVGWVHQVAAIIARHRVNLGSLVLSTLRLTGREVGEDPLADWLLHQLIATAWEQ